MLGLTKEFLAYFMPGSRAPGKSLGLSVPDWTTEISAAFCAWNSASGKGLGLSVPGWITKFSGVLFARNSGCGRRPRVKHAWFDHKIFRHALCQDFGLEKGPGAKHA